MLSNLPLQFFLTDFILYGYLKNMSSTQDTGAKVPNNPHFMNFPLYHAILFNELTFHNKINLYFFIHVKDVKEEKYMAYYTFLTNVLNL
jgi:hypothetical protein